MRRIIIIVIAGLTLVGLYKAGAMEDIGCSPVQILVFSSLIVAVDPVAVSYSSKLIMTNKAFMNYIKCFITLTHPYNMIRVVRKPAFYTPGIRSI